MITLIYSLFDVKASVYGTPFFMPNKAMALRAFSDLVRDDRTMVGRHPEDFILYEIGKFDDHTGEVLNEKPVSLGHATQFLGGDVVSKLIPPKGSVEKTLVS